ncbi:MAG TPA: ferritin-like domain-containing protein [Thermomicrobiales bacterium]|nr:ferritin-like domain-containing protein [Thermomicrobiales bacterium]
MGRQTHELILDAVSQGRPSHRGGAKLVAGTALALAAVPAMGALRARAQTLETEVDVLNYALTLEHLEATFYREGLETFGPDAFEAGVYDNLVLVRDHEAAHVETLVQTIIDLGGTPVEEAEYDFGYGDDPDAFLEVAATLENVGVSAYDGAAQFLTTPALVTAAGTIVAVEARHASYLNLITGEVPFPQAFETPLAPEEVLDAAGGFIVS